MRKLATIALLALSLLTVACTESEDADTDFEAASIDEPTDLVMTDEIDSLTERAPGGSDPLVDRVGPTERDVAPGQPATGTAECRTSTAAVANNQPVIGVASDELGARARERFDRMAKLRGFR